MAEEERERQEGTAGGTAVEVSDDERAARRERARARKRRRAASGEGASASGSAGARARDPELMRPPRRDDPGEGGYEFGDAENVKFRGLAGLMQFVGWTGIVLALVAGIWGFPKHGSSSWSYLLWVLQILLPILVGTWTLRAAGSFKRIATTRGNDVAHLMEAVGELTKLYTLQAVVVVVAMALIVLAMVLVTTFTLR
ncbi:MAG: hypothetical protein IT373_35345 [Polyangiaceae bacterium]|nr:hypothetical protein [Polyangiaceae bacterium]